MKKRVMLIILSLTVVMAMMPVNVGAATAQLQALKKPSMTVYAHSSTSITVKWSKVKKATGYEIYRAAVNSKGNYGKFKKVKTVKKGKITKWTNKKLKKNHDYGYKVRAVRNGKKGKFSTADWTTATSGPACWSWMSGTSDYDGTTSSISIVVQNGGSKTMYFDSYGLYVIDMTDDVYSSANTESCTLISDKIIKPGQVKTLVYDTDEYYVPYYACLSAMGGSFAFGGKEYFAMFSYSEGAYWEPMSQSASTGTLSLGKNIKSLQNGAKIKNAPNTKKLKKVSVN